MDSVLEEVSERPNFSRIEEAVLKRWEGIDAFQTSLKLSEGRPEYTFYDGPPFATGLPHYGHILAGTIKDVVTRYAHQTGFHVSRRFGWDCHGLPVEFEIDKKLDIKGADDVKAMGIDKYNAECKSIVTRYCKEWETTVNRLGRWIDFRNDYKTMEPWYMESVWWVFSEIFKKGLVYQGFKVMPYSTTCNTPLSNFEANLNYQEVSDPAVIVGFPLIEDPESSIIIWTTTPWTLPSNLAVCVHPDFVYIKLKDASSGKQYILAEARISSIYPAYGTKKFKEGSFTILAKMKGSELVGKRYTPIFDYYSKWSQERKNCAWKIVADTYVTEDGGTGCVHQAPAFGEDDFRVCLANGIVFKGDGIPCPVDQNGRFTKEVPDWEGQHVKAADESIMNRLKEMGRLVNKNSIVHNYPFCWRSDTPLIYKAVTSWFVNVETIKEDLLKSNDETYWVPSFVKEKRFYNWLKDAKDWAISRNRYWGTPLPIWMSDDGEETVCISSIKMLEDLSGRKITDLHREFIDDVTIPSTKGKGVLRRIPEVFDCWFESGSMPYAQQHYPFENKEVFENGFPADFIAEGLDQTRGWFYTLMVISTAIFKKPPFKNLIVNGLVLAADGKKMSKRLKNYPPPEKCLNEYGADALRMYLIDSPVVRAEPLKFSEPGVSGVVRDKIIPWYHAFRFFIENAKRLESETGNKFVADAAKSSKSTNLMDQWILSTLNSLVLFVREEMKAYRLYTVVPKLVSFLDDLTNWYVRLNRPRLKGVGGVEDNIVALSTLFEVLMSLCRLMAPLTPFCTEYQYLHLRRFHVNFNNTSLPVDAIGRAESVHYVMIPEYNASLNIPKIERQVGFLQQVVVLGRRARERRNISLKMPITSLTVVNASAEVLADIKATSSYINSELNMEDLFLDTNEKKWCKLYSVPDNKALGQRLGKDFKNIKPLIEGLTHEQLLHYEEHGSIEVGGVTLGSGDIQIKREFNNDATKYEAVVSDDGKLMVIVDTTVNEILVSKGTAREVTNRVQKMRKSASLAVTDDIEVFYKISGTNAEANNVLQRAIENNVELIVSVIRRPLVPAQHIPNYRAIILKEQSEINDSFLELTITTSGVAVNEATLLKTLGANVTHSAEVSQYVSSHEIVSFKNEVEKNGGKFHVCLKDNFDAGSKKVDVDLQYGRDFFYSVAEKLASK